MADRSLIEGAEPLPRREEAPEWGYEEGEQRAATPPGETLSAAGGGGGGVAISVAEGGGVRSPAVPKRRERGSAVPQRAGGQRGAAPLPAEQPLP